jgi:hypothetical protein
MESLSQEGSGPLCFHPDDETRIRCFIYKVFGRTLPSDMKCLQRCQGFQRQLPAGRSNGLHELRAGINQDVVDNCQVGKFRRQNQVEPANQGGVFYTASSRIILKATYSAIGINGVPSGNQISCTQLGGTQATRQPI